MDSPKISVLMAAYNAEKYIAEAIQSILDQTFEDFEFIIINDGSTDKTCEIIKSFKDPRIIFVDNEKNQGLIAVLNQGLGMARGEYVARMDADDVSMPERFEKQVTFMDANPDIGVLGTNSFRWDMMNPKKSRLYNPPPEIMDYIFIMRGGRPDHPTTMLRMSIIRQHNFYYNPDYVRSEDYELWSRMIRVTKIGCLPECLLKHRMYSENMLLNEGKLQKYNNKRVAQNMMNWLTNNDLLQNELRKIVHGWMRIGIPLIKVRYKSGKMIYRLFGFIPVRVIKKQKAV